MARNVHAAYETSDNRRIPINQGVYKDFTFSSCSFSAGTIGTRGNQYSASVSISGYTPVSATIVSLSDSSSCMPITFISGTTVYLNLYRASASAASGISATVRVAYLKA